MKNILAILSILVIAACAPRIGGTDVSANYAGVPSKIQYGTVTGLYDVVVNNDDSGTVTLGTLGGAAAGGVLGNQIGNGSGRTIATVGGAILGAIAGSEMTKITSEQKGYQITIKLDNGTDMAVVQGTDIKFGIGQRVQVISTGGKVRVLPAH